MSRSTAIRLPDFLVIGAYKSGTTSLHHWLRQHPDVFLPEVKEPNYFAFEGLAPDDAASSPAARASVRTFEEYARLFAAAAGAGAVGEVSPEYLANPRACERIRRRLPTVRLVAVLRNPVERAWSDYLMYVRDGLEPYPDDFGRALAEQEERRRRGDPTGYYVRTGFYADQLQPYVERFGPDQLQVHLFDDLVHDPVPVVQAIFRFVGVDDGFVPPSLAPHNASGVPANRVVRAAYRARRALQPRLGPVVPERVKTWADRALGRGLRRRPLPAAARAALVETYRDDVVRLQAMIGRDLSHWLR